VHPTTATPLPKTPEIRIKFFCSIVPQPLDAAASVPRQLYYLVPVSRFNVIGQQSTAMSQELLRAPISRLGTFPGILYRQLQNIDDK
jgi:hypothetical protein